MSNSILTNVSSMSAQSQLNKSQNLLSTTLQRLSSGLRINSAKDDAAGLAISERMTAQIKGLNQASRNANDAISLSQTAEGALGTIADNLQRIRELSTQSANATNSSSDRSALQAEVSQLTADIDRIATTTNFNGIKLLDGTFTSQAFQVGADANQTISVSGISSARTATLGSYYTANVTGTAVTGALAASDLNINGVNVGATSAGSQAGQTADSAYAVAQAINAVSGHNVTATANATSVVGAAPAAAGAIAAGAFSINGVNVGAIAAGGSVVTQGANVAAEINKISAATGVTAAADNTGAITLTAADGRNIAIAGTVTNTGLTAATTRGTVSLATNPGATASNGIVIAGNAPAGAGLTAGTTNASLTGTALSAIDISSASGATSALQSVDAALNSVNSARASLGAYQNRFLSVISNLQNASENMSASRSRIMDADLAAETANMTKAQILQQAGVSMVAQANSSPNVLLSLLRG